MISVTLSKLLRAIECTITHVTTIVSVTLTAPSPITPRLIDTVLQAMDEDKVKQFIRNAEQQNKILIREKAHLQDLIETLGKSNDDLQHRVVDLEDMLKRLIQKNREILSMVPGTPISDIDQSNIDKMTELFSQINQHTLREFFKRIADLENKLNKSNQEKLAVEAKINELNRQFEDEIAKMRSTFDEKLKDLDNRKADKADLDKLRTDFMNDMENSRYKYLDELKNKIDQLERLERLINDQVRRTDELERDYRELGSRLKEDINDLRNAISERLSVSRDAAKAINDLNYKIKSLKSEMDEIKKYIDRSKPQNTTNNYNNIYNDHRDLHNDLVNTLKKLIQTFQQNQPQLRTPPEKFDEKLWQQLIEKLNDAKAAGQSYTYNHKMLHQNYNVDNSVSNVQKNLYQFFYLTGEKTRNPKDRPLMDPSTLALTDSASPEVINVEGFLDGAGSVPSLAGVEYWVFILAWGRFHQKDPGASGDSLPSQLLLHFLHISSNFGPNDKDTTTKTTHKTVNEHNPSDRLKEKKNHLDFHLGIISGSKLNVVVLKPLLFGENSPPSRTSSMAFLMGGGRGKNALIRRRDDHQFLESRKQSLKPAFLLLFFDA
uniref:Uncharacterized protein n=1 Tax=Romanomermis culicivorax TaxID=13658 RepID=A0A915JBH8_ROMCU